MDLVPQALINGLVAGTLLAVPAICFTAMFAVLRFPNFSVSGVATFGAFAGYVAYGSLGLPIAASLVVAFAGAGAAGLLFDRIAHLPLAKQGALPAAIASIATGLVLENVIRFCFGNELRGYDRPIARDMRIGDIRVSPQQLETMGIALAIMLLVFAALAFTRIGKAMRASADNPKLAALKGIRPERVAAMASFVGMGLVGVGGMLLGLDSSIDPLTGTRILLSILAAAVLGGLGSAPGAALGAFLIGMSEELSVLVVGSVRDRRGSLPARPRPQSPASAPASVAAVGRDRGFLPAGGVERTRSEQAPRSGRRGTRHSAGRWWARVALPSPRPPSGQRAGALDPRAQQFDLHAQFANPLHGRGQFTGGGITPALLQSAIKGRVSLLAPLLQFVDRYPELTAE